MFYTGHMDANLDRTFVSCVSGAEVKSDMWSLGEPTLEDKNEACAAIVADDDGVSLSAVRCDKQYQVICEVLACSFSK